MSTIVTDDPRSFLDKDGKFKRDWKLAIEAAQAHRSAKIGHTRKYYEMWRDNFEGLPHIAGKPHHRVTVNMVFANTAVLLPLVYFKNPHLSVIPRRPHKMITTEGPVSGLPDYELMERIVNHKMGEMRYYRTERMIALDTSLAGTGISKVGYSQVFEHDEIRGETFIEEDELWIQRVDPFRFLVDPLALDEHSARWMGEELLLPFTEVLRRYGDSKILDKLRPTHKFVVQQDKNHSHNADGGHTVFGLERIAENEQAFDPELSVVLVYEIWDITEKKVLVLADGFEDEPLQEEDWPFNEMFEFPYEVVRFHEDPDSIWGLSPVKFYEAQQHELNFHRSKLASMHGKLARKYGVLTGALEPEERDKLERGDDGAVIEFKFPPDRAFKNIQENVVNNDTLNVSAFIKDDINTLSGVDEATRGQVTKGRTTATEIARLTQGLEIRSDDKRSQIEKHIKYTWKKGVQILIEKMSGTQYANYYDEEKEVPAVVAFTSSDIEGNFDVEIEVGSTQLPNKEVKQQLLLNLAQIILASPNVNQKEFFRQVFKTFDIDPSGMLQEAPPPEISTVPGQQAPTGGGAQESRAGEPTSAGIRRATGGQISP